MVFRKGTDLHNSCANLLLNRKPTFSTPSTPLHCFTKRRGKLDSYLVLYLVTYTSLQTHMPVTRFFTTVTGFAFFINNVSTCSNIAGSHYCCKTCPQKHTHEKKTPSELQAPAMTCHVTSSSPHIITRGNVCNTAINISPHTVHSPTDAHLFKL